ncbi:hypothetical protein GNF18_10400 [Ligilactobacillus pobuzihii]|uniref:hypothetical protein n=1 Tax=Ligilactobacillus pobuzihii TaxID=449659 RepID=UPI0019D12447|nr:hypothetical protein [Ligilactobacillus pobuzihii]MBN7275551.1 hypothetical protein [Ligilactobacillus pobuzihii]
MKKFLSVLGVLFLGSLILASCSYATAYKGSKIYKTDVTKVMEDGLHNWILVGKTDAPDGSKIIVTPADTNNSEYGAMESESESGGSWAVVKKGTFAASVAPATTSTSQKQGVKTKVLVFAISNYDKKWNFYQLPKRMLKKVNRTLEAETLTITKSQERFYNSLDDDE